MATDADLANEFFQIRRHGDIAVVVPSPQVEHLPETLLEPAAQLVLAPLREDPPGQIIVDLAGVKYFGSAFITFLLRCHHLIADHGSDLVLAGVNPNIRELLRTPTPDTPGALYAPGAEALSTLGGGDWAGAAACPAAVRSPCSFARPRPRPSRRPTSTSATAA